MGMNILLDCLAALTGASLGLAAIPGWLLVYSVLPFPF
jgi:hypothetical protein